jgi:hypothetical protein
MKGSDIPYLVIPRRMRRTKELDALAAVELASAPKSIAVCRPLILDNFDTR